MTGQNAELAGVVLYGTTWCGFSRRAKALLEERGVPFVDADLDMDPRLREKLFALTGGWTIPQVVIDGEVIGGYDALVRLDRDGGLERLRG